MQAITAAMVMYSVLFPAKMWIAPDQPVNVSVKGAGGEITLIMTDFAGKPVDSVGEGVVVNGDQTVQLEQSWPQLRAPGTFILFAVPKGKTITEFIGTPLVIGVRADNRRDAPPGPMVIHIEPLLYAVLSTDKGDMTLGFFYDVAPDTVDNFLTLGSQAFYDGLAFHRIVPGFVIQGGDPRGDGTGGPGYHIESEFNSRKHEEGVLSMARQGDPIERQGAMPRAEAANSAGSQFFICLDYERTKQLDGRYSAFAKVVDGIEIVRALAKVPTDPQTDRPTTPQLIKSVRVMPVTPQKFPYVDLIRPPGTTTLTPEMANPTTRP